MKTDWIDVNERLPPEGVQVLMWDGDESLTGVYEEGFWWMWTSEGYSKVISRYYAITHWDEHPDCYPPDILSSG